MKDVIPYIIKNYENRRAFSPPLRDTGIFYGGIKSPEKAHKFPKGEKTVSF
jgi:hypothetical protein